MSLEIPKTAGTVSLAYCVAQAKMEMDVFTEIKYDEKFTQLALNSFADFNMFISKQIEVAYKTINSDGYIELPNDYIELVKLGIPVGGKLYNLGINNKILLRRSEISSTAAAQIFNGEGEEIDIPLYGYYYIDHYYNNEYIGGLYGLGGGFSPSFYRIDREKNQIQFDTAVPRNEVVLEYVSTGIKNTSSTVIPRDMVPYVVSFIIYKHYSRNRKVSGSFRSEMYQIMIEEENKLLNRKYTFNIDEYLRTMHSVHSQTVHR